MPASLVCSSSDPACFYSINFVVPQKAVVQVLVQRVHACASDSLPVACVISEQAPCEGTKYA